MRRRPGAPRTLDHRYRRRCRRSGKPEAGAPLCNLAPHAATTRTKPRQPGDLRAVHRHSATFARGDRHSRLARRPTAEPGHLHPSRHRPMAHRLERPLPHRWQWIPALGHHKQAGEHLARRSRPRLAGTGRTHRRRGSMGHRPPPPARPDPQARGQSGRTAGPALRATRLDDHRTDHRPRHHRNEQGPTAPGIQRPPSCPNHCPPSSSRRSTPDPGTRPSANAETHRGCSPADNPADRSAPPKWANGYVHSESDPTRPARPPCSPSPPRYPLRSSPAPSVSTSTSRSTDNKPAPATGLATRRGRPPPATDSVTERLNLEPLLRLRFPLSIAGRAARRRRPLSPPDARHRTIRRARHRPARWRRGR
ncbi:hypothetical protein DEU38_112130 [Rhodococcus sp. AG1013]|nr:hypothetical protein DEU38_112130 [Rhodococcus sp. AG1013]